MTAHSARPRSGPHASRRGPVLGRRVARLNRAVTNKISIHVAGWAPGLGIVIHVGRRTHSVYRTPVNVFWTKDGFRFALTYGRDAEWVRNALAHGAVRLITRRREFELTDPEIVHDPHRQHVGLIARGFLHLLRVSDFLDVRRAGVASSERPR
jgi:deazaflavin-dependent oxidoreductase (nitroreductase family)